MSQSRNQSTFPVILHNLLCQSEKLGVDNIISWDSTGAKVVVKNEAEFVSNILPIMFKQSKYESFRRQLNAYNFKREKPSPWLVYANPNFRKENPDACANIGRRYSRPASKKLFEEMEKVRLHIASDESTYQNTLTNPTEETHNDRVDETKDVLGGQPQLDDSASSVITHDSIFDEMALAIFDNAKSDGDDASATTIPWDIEVESLLHDSSWVL